MTQYNNEDKNNDIKLPCVHVYIKDFGITKCTKCEFKLIRYLSPLKKNNQDKDKVVFTTLLTNPLKF